MFFSQYFSFPCQYHSTIAPYSFIYLPPALYNVFLPALQYSPVSIIPPLLHTHSFIYHPHCITFFSQHFSFPLSVSFHYCQPCNSGRPQSNSGLSTAPSYSRFFNSVYKSMDMEGTWLARLHLDRLELCTNICARTFVVSTVAVYLLRVHKAY